MSRPGPEAPNLDALVSWLKAGPYDFKAQCLLQLWDEAASPTVAFVLLCSLLVKILFLWQVQTHAAGHARVAWRIKFWC